MGFKGLDVGAEGDDRMKQGLGNFGGSMDL